MSIFIVSAVAVSGAADIIGRALVIRKELSAIRTIARRIADPGGGVDAVGVDAVGTAVHKTAGYDGAEPVDEMSMLKISYVL